jgi:maleate isomerase
LVDADSDMTGRTIALGIVVPAFNTTVEIEYTERRPPGVYHFVARIPMPDRPLTTDAEQARVVLDAVDGLDQALVAVAAARPRVIVLGISIPTFWDGPAGADALRQRCERVAGRPVILAADAVRDALHALPSTPRLGILTPYQAEANRRVAAFVRSSGIEVAAVESLEPPRNYDIALVPPDGIVDAINRLAAAGADVVLQVGTNVRMGREAADCAAAAGCRLLAVNELVYDLALRRAERDLGTAGAPAGAAPTI